MFSNEAARRAITCEPPIVSYESLSRGFQMAQYEASRARLKERGAIATADHCRAEAKRWKQRAIAAESAVRSDIHTFGLSGPTVSRIAMDDARAKAERLANVTLNQNRELEAKLRNASANLSAMQSAHGVLVGNLEKQIAVLKAERSRLECEARERDPSALSEKLRRSEAELERLKGIAAEVHEAKHEAKLQRENCDAWRKRVDSLEAQLREARHAMRTEAQGQRIAELEAQLGSAERKAEQSEESIRVVRQACESTVTRFQAKLDEAARERDALKAQNPLLLYSQREELQRLRGIVAQLECCLRSEDLVHQLIAKHRARTASVAGSDWRPE